MIKQVAEFIREKIKLKNPRTAVILGSGLSGFTAELTDVSVLDYKDIPDFPQSTVAGHKGQFIRGFANGEEILCLNGRFHLYEGHKPAVIADVVHTLKDLGITRLIVTNAAGSLNKDIKPGDLMLIKDHINFSGRNPLVGANDERYGVRFPPMNNAYTEKLRRRCREIAEKQKIKIKEGVYLMVLGPNFETAAEVRTFAMLGADAVGMSTVPEVIAAVHCGMEVLGISVITNYAAGLMNNTPSHQETLTEADKAAARMSALLNAFIREEK